MRPRQPKSDFPVSRDARRQGLGPAALAVAVSLAASSLAHAGPLERVPQDGTLQQALDRVSGGGVIEIAGGVYPVPEDGLRSLSSKRFTVRAAAGASVVLDGEGSRRILLLRGEGAGAGRTVAFEGITFRGGYSSIANRAGGVTIESGEAVFVSCAFESNLHDGDNGGAAVRIAGPSDVRFTHSRFADNRSQRWGAAIFAQDSRVEVTWSELTRNRTNIAGHSAISAGGAIFILDSRLSISRSRFTDNEAGWVGGAIYSIGNWHEAPEGVPASQVTIADSVFVHNLAAPHPCCGVPGAPGGGALHAEDQSDVLIRGSRFDENVAAWGGAISAYRALIEVEGSVFRGNRGEPTDTIAAAGGTINVTSSDFSDPSTDFGASNRRPAELHLRDSLLLGRFGTTAHAAQQGGCLFVEGDQTRLAGNGVPQDGTAADNRARVTLDHVVFADCDVLAGPQGSAFGGAIMTILADLEMTSSQVFDSDAFGPPASGGALLDLHDSRLIFDDSTFARNTAVDAAAGLLVNGGHVEISDCLFVDNDVSPGLEESEAASPGSALVLARTNELGLTGVVERSLFTGNSGIPIVDRDSLTGTSNKVAYVENRIHSTRFGTKVYKNVPMSFAGLTVAQLNSLVVQHADGPSDKGTANAFLASPPRAGSLVAAPAVIAAPEATGDPTLASAFLGYVWSGASAELAGGGLASKTGLLEVADSGIFELRVDGSSTATATVGEQPCSRGRLLCLNQDRFLVEAHWRDPQGVTGAANVVLGANDSGLFWFFSDNNWEMLVKVLDGCALNQNFWVFAAATTDVEYTLRVTDTETGATASYFNPLGNAAAAITDTAALATCDASAPAPSADRPPLPLPGALRWDAAKQGTCVAGSGNLCLNQDRFDLEIEWRTASGGSGSGQVVPFGSDDSGLFWFFSDNNWEMLVKVLDGCALNDRYWVFAAATTDVGYTLRVTDTETGQVKVYTNPVGRAAPATTDTDAFATCP